MLQATPGPIDRKQWDGRPSPMKASMCESGSVVDSTRKERQLFVEGVLLIIVVLRLGWVPRQPAVAGVIARMGPRAFA